MTQMYMMRVDFEPCAFSRCGSDPETVLVERIEALGTELGLRTQAVLVGETSNATLRSTTVGQVLEDAAGW